MTLKERLLEVKSQGRRTLTNESLSGIIDEVISELDKSQPVEPQKLFDINGKRVIILAPIYRGLNGRTFFTLWRAFAQYGVEKIGLIPEFQTVIHEARNMLAKKFLESDSEWAVMVDDDMVIPCGSAPIINGYFKARLPEQLASLNALSRLMSHPADKLVVGSLYFIKGNPNVTGDRMSGRAICEQAFRDDNFNKELHVPSKDSGLIRQDWVGLGLCRIHRSVFERIAAAAEGRWPEIINPNKDRHLGWFQPMGPDVNEDTSFGKRCKALGIDHWIDSGLVCGHCDGTTTYWPFNTI